MRVEGVALVFAITALAVITLVTASSSSFGPLGRRPFELTLHRPSAQIGYVCSVIHVRETQLHRLLGTNDSSFIIEKHESLSGDGKGTVERIRIFAYDEHVLWEQAHRLCGGFEPLDFSDWLSVIETPISVSESPKNNEIYQNTQIVLPELRHNLPQSPVPLEIKHIAGSGTSSNRIDITFFSDGCKYDISLCFVQSVNTRNFQCRAWLADFLQ